MTDMNTLKWKRSEEGSTETHCGRYSIEPIFNHAATPQGYNLYFNLTPGKPGRIKLRSWLDTQTECKDEAARHEAKEHPAMITKQALRASAKSRKNPGGPATDLRGFTVPGESEQIENQAELDELREQIKHDPLVRIGAAVLAEAARSKKPK